MENNISVSSQIDLNQAGLETLTTLPGIGPALAARIVRYREEVKPFEEAAEITTVPGISEKMYRQFAAAVTVSPTGQEARAVSPPASDPAPETETATISTEGETEVQTVITEAISRPEVAVVEAAPPPASESGLVPSSARPVETKNRPQAETPPPAAPPLPRPPGPGFWARSCLLTTVGLLGGALLALLLIQRINGTLDMGAHPRLLQLSDELSALEQQEETLNGEIRELRTRLNQVEALSGRLQNAEADIQALNEALAALDEQMATLEEDTSQIQQSVNQIQAAADRFDNFLTGLRDLLLVTEGTPAPAATPTLSTIISPTPIPTDSVEATPAVTGSPLSPSTTTPTRTPRPTRTPAPTPTVTGTPVSGFIPLKGLAVETPFA